MTKIYIQKRSSKIELTFANNKGTEHHVSLPATYAGFQTLVRILQADELAHERNERVTIASEAAPMQTQVEEWLAKGNKVKKADGSDLSWLDDALAQGGRKARSGVG